MTRMRATKMKQTMRLTIAMAMVALMMTLIMMMMKIMMTHETSTYQFNDDHHGATRVGTYVLLTRTCWFLYPFSPYI